MKFISPKHYSLNLRSYHLSSAPFQLASEEGNSILLQSLAHSLRSRERLIQVGEMMRGDRTQSCKPHCDFLPLFWALTQFSLECCLSWSVCTRF